MSGNKKAITDIGNSCIGYEEVHKLLRITIDSTWRLKTILINLAKRKAKNKKLLLKLPISFLTIVNIDFK